MLNSGESDVVAALERQFESVRQLEKQLEALKRKAAGSIADQLLEDVRLVKEVRFIAAKVDGFGRESLRQLVDSLRKSWAPEWCLATAEDGKVALITAVTKDLTARVHAAN